MSLLSNLRSGRFTLGGKNDLIGLEFLVGGVAQLNRGLGLLIDKSHDLRGAWPDIYKDFLEGEKREFSRQGRHGVRWAALSPRYAAWKARMYPGKKILERTGRLRRSLTEKGGPDSVFVPGKQSLTMGATTEYGQYHQAGTRRMPARPPIQLTAKQKQTWPKIIQQYIWASAQPYFRRQV